MILENEATAPNGYPQSDRRRASRREAEAPRRFLSAAFLLAMLTLAVTGAAHAQAPSGERVIIGLVLDEDGVEGIPGAVVALHRVDSTLGRVALGIRTSTDANGFFRLVSPVATEVALDVSAIGRSPSVVRLSDTPKENDTVYILLLDAETVAHAVEVTGRRRTRSVEDGCCRVESIREEVQQHAPFSPSPVESLRRYSSCTAGRVVNTIDDAGTISLRGLEPTRVGLLVDGLPLLNGLGTFYGLSMIPSHALQTISIAEGASDGRYGDRALSGIVDIQTRMPTEHAELNGSIVAAGASIDPDQIDANLGATGMAGTVGLAAFASYNDHASAIDDGGLLLERHYRRASGMVKGNVMIGESTELVATALGGVESRRGTVDALLPAAYRHDLDLSMIDGMIRATHFVGEQGMLEASGGVVRFGLDGTFDSIAADVAQTSAVGDLSWSDLAGDHTYRIGAQARSVVIANDGAATIDDEVSALSLYAQDAMALGERVTLFGSLRADRHSRAGILVSPRASFRYAPSSELMVRVMAGQGFKSEALFDEDYRALIGTLRWRANRDAAFERSLTVSADASWNHSFSASLGVTSNLALYTARIDGKLVADADSLAAGTLFYVNADRPGRLIGMEWQNRFTIGAEWSASLAVALIDYRMEDAAGVDRPVPLAPRFNLDGSVMWRGLNSGLLVEAWGSLVGPQQLPAPVDGRDMSPIHALANIRIEKELGLISLLAGARNIFDVRQSRTTPLVTTSPEATGDIAPDGSTAWGPAEGREFFLGVRMSLPTHFE